MTTHLASLGFLLWSGLTLLTLLAGFALALRIGHALTLAEKCVAAVVTATGIVIAVMQALGYSGHLRGWLLAAGVGGIDGALLAFHPPGDAWRSLWRHVRSAARRCLELPALIVALPALCLVFYMSACIYLMPSWGWDATWYHNTITAYAFQEHSLGWIETPIGFVNGYPRNIELLALWNVIFAPDDRLIDGVQLPLVLTAVLALAEMCRRAGAPPFLALGLGTCWLLVPAVFLNVPSNYVDSGIASLWLMAVLFLARTDATAVHRLFGAIALGLTAGSKVTGGMYAVAMAPVVGLVLLHQVWTRRARPSRLLTEPLAMTAIICALGVETYLRDLIRFGNPVWPTRARVFGRTLPGNISMAEVNTPPWGGPDDLEALWRSFQTTPDSYIVDIRAGGFGPLWTHVLIPLIVIAFLIGAWRLVQRAGTAGLLAAAVILVTATATPASWWCRYTLGFPAAGLLAAAIVVARIPWSLARKLSFVGIGVFALVQAWPARTGFRVPMDVFWGAWSMTPEQRAAIHLAPWIAPAELRERTLPPGSAAVYDDSLAFVYPLWRFDWKNRVLYRPLKGDPKAWVSSIESEGASWAALRRGSPAERAVSEAGWNRLGNVWDTTFWTRSAVAPEPRASPAPTRKRFPPIVQRH
jgi:hypothetical protein